MRTMLYAFAWIVAMAVACMVAVPPMIWVLHKPLGFMAPEPYKVGRPYPYPSYIVCAPK